MSGRYTLERVRRVLSKPPGVIVERLAAEFRAERERWLAPRLLSSFGEQQLCQRVGASSIAELWERLARRQWIGVPDQRDHPAFRADQARIVAAAEKAIARRVDLLGSGEVDLGEEIDWHQDYKTGHRWPQRFHRDIDYTNLDRPSDVKFPWELSRLQWLMPAAQAYLLCRDERFAASVRKALDSWIAANPYGFGVNWACTMEVALRIVSWTWLFGCLHDSDSWRDSAFRVRFLSALYLHCRYTERHLEKSTVNGNHYLADAAGLVFGGLFFGDAAEPSRWTESGWRILREELPKQVSVDGVDYEGSIAYHRLVTELFLLPALLRLRHGLDVDDLYRQRLIGMGQFVAAYSRPDGSAPLVGDADDGRVLPLGGQDLNDHRYLVGIIATVLGGDDWPESQVGPTGEALWLLGPGSLEGSTATSERERSVARSMARGGYYVMANSRDHVFVDCAPVGLAGRGGHGHNDCLSFEAVLDGTLLVSDAGAYLYTASAEERDRFRSTAYHNTPQVDGEEINRFLTPNSLWSLRFDAWPTVERWLPTAEHDVLIAGHVGYSRLPDPVRIRRSFCLLHASHRLIVRDDFEAAEEHRYRVPLLLAPGVEILDDKAGSIRLQAGHRHFHIGWWEPGDWTLAIEDGRVSPSYGVAVPTSRLAFTRTGRPLPLTLVLEPEDTRSTEPPDLDRLLTADDA